MGTILVAYLLASIDFPILESLILVTARTFYDPQIFQQV